MDFKMKVAEKLGNSVAEKLYSEIIKLREKFTEDDILKAIDIASSVNKVTLNYIRGILHKKLGK